MTDHEGVDWIRIARPQVDGYDSAIALRLAKTNTLPGFGWLRVDPSRPSRTLLDGRVYVRHVHDPCPWSNLVNARLDAPTIEGAIEQLQTWPEIAEQLAALIDTIQPVSEPEASGEHYRSCSGCSEGEFGLIYVTVEHPVTMAEALVHELAHAKLHALGIGVTAAARLIRNDPTRVYESPVIRDRPRPMTAVFHAIYTFSHILELDLRMARAAGEDHPRLRLLCDLVAYALVRVQHGLATVRREVELDADGLAFMAGYYAWADELVSAGHEFLDARVHAGAKLPELGYASVATASSPAIWREPIAEWAPGEFRRPMLLDFRLHEFLRVSWVSATARTIWAERLQAARLALEKIAVTSTGADGYPILLRLDSVYPHEVAGIVAKWAQAGLAAERLDLAAERVSRLDACHHPSDARRVFVLVGQHSAIDAAKSAARADDRMAWHAAFGRPDCCAEARNRAYDMGLHDPLWALWFGSRACGQTMIEGDLRWTGNTLALRLGFSPLPFVPCWVECDHAAVMTEATVAYARRLGYEREMDDLVELMNWPMAWSTLHGIAELRTPLFKAMWNSDSTAEHHELQLRSSCYPAEAPTGLRFPHPAPRRRFVSDSKRFARGLENPLDSAVDVALTRLARVRPRDTDP
jgi:hypothetical protein